MRPDMGEWDTIDRNVYGAPLPVWQVLANPNWGHLRGIEVEHAVATSLNLLTYEFPSIHIFHSSSLEEDRQNEVDSILVYKNLILLIEAKASPPNNRFLFGQDGKIRRYAPRPRGSKIRQTKYAGNQLEKKIETFQQAFPSMQVYGMYVFHGSDAVQMSQQGRMQIVPFAQLLTVVRTHLTAHGQNTVTVTHQQETSQLRERLLASQAGMGRTVKKMLKRNPDLMVFQDSLILQPQPETFRDRLEATINIWRK